MPNKLISIGEIIDRSINIYQKHFANLISISSWMLIVVILNIIALGLYPSAGKMIASEVLTSTESAGVIIYALTNFIISPIIAIFILVMLVRALKMVLAGKTIDTSKVMHETKTRIIPTILISIMVFFVILFASVISFSPAAILAMVSLWTQSTFLVTATNILLIIGVFAALILTIKWSVRFYLAPYITASDDIKGKKSLIYSQKITDKKFWGVLLRLVLPKIVFLMIGVLIILFFGFIMSIVASTISGLNLNLELRIITLSDTIVPILASIFVQPLIIITDMILLNNLKGSVAK